MDDTLRVSAKHLAQMREPSPYLRYEGNGIVMFDENALGRDAGVDKYRPAKLGTIAWLLTSTNHYSRLFARAKEPRS